MKANYYLYALNDQQTRGFMGAIDAYNNSGKAHNIKDLEGNNIYVVFELTAIVVENGSIAAEMAGNDVITVEQDGNVAKLSFGNTVTNGVAGDAKHLGNAKNSWEIVLDKNATENFYNKFKKQNVSISQIYKGVAVHEIGHNLGANHNDPGFIMIDSKGDYNTGSGINQTERTVFSTPSVNSQGIQAIMGRMVDAKDVIEDYRAGYGQVGTRYFGQKENVLIKEKTNARLVNY